MISHNSQIGSKIIKIKIKNKILNRSMNWKLYKTNSKAYIIRGIVMCQFKIQIKIQLHICKFNSKLISYNP